MSERPLMASLGHDKVPAFRGTFMFDGRVLESFGFGEIRSTRIPIELIDKPSFYA